jgi:hypothetical protein
MVFICEFQHTSLWKIIFSQCSTPPMGMRFCRHLPNPPRDKKKMSHDPCLLEKVVFWAFKTLLSPFGSGKKTFLSTLNVMISRTVRNECTRFGGHIDIEVSYKVLWLEILNETLILLNSPCF